MCTEGAAASSLGEYGYVHAFIYLYNALMKYYVHIYIYYVCV